jgi:hypothetical protein
VSDRDIVEQLSEIGVKPAEVKARLEKVLEAWLAHRKAEHRWDKCPPSKFRIELDVRARAFLRNRRWSGFKPKKMKAKAVNKYAQLYKTWFTIQQREDVLDLGRRSRAYTGRGQRLAAKFKTKSQR